MGELDPIGFGVCFAVLVWIRVKVNVIFDGRALRWIADSDAGHAAKCALGWVGVGRFTLVTAGINFPHDLAANHADFIAN